LSDQIRRARLQQQAPERQSREEPSPAPASVLLYDALAKSRTTDGVWLNQGGRKAPSFNAGERHASPFAQLVMALHAERMGYRTYSYMTFDHIKSMDSLSVIKGSKGLALSWFNQGSYVNTCDEKDVISNEAFQSLDPQMQGIYQLQRQKVSEKVFNLDQTNLGEVNPERYESMAAGLGDHAGMSLTHAEMMNTAHVHEGMERIRQSYPGKLLLLDVGFGFEAYRDDAREIYHMLGLSVPEDFDDRKKLTINNKDWDTFIGKALAAGRQVLVIRDIESATLVKVAGGASDVYDKVDDFISSFLAGTPDSADNIRENFGISSYWDSLRFPVIRKVSPGSDVTTALESLSSAYRSAIAYTGEADRLDRRGDIGLLEDDYQKYELLVQELSSAVIMLRQGFAARLSDKGQQMLDFWLRDLQEKPALADRLERDVNDAVDVVDAIVCGRKVDYGLYRQGRSHVNLPASEYTIVSHLGLLADEKEKKAVLVRDDRLHKADVILSRGAGESPDGGIAMHRNSFIVALKNEGYQTVRFFNASGMLSMLKPNSYFDGKRVEVVTLEGYDLKVHARLDLFKEFSKSDDCEIERLTFIRDDKDRPMFSITPVGGEPFAVYASRDDVKELDKALSEGKHYGQTCQEIGKKYCALVARNEYMRHDLPVPEYGTTRLDGIKSVSIARDREEADCYVIVASVDGDRLDNAVLTKQEIEVFWSCQDKDGYALAAAGAAYGEQLGSVREDVVGEDGRKEDGTVNISSQEAESQAVSKGLSV
ncbi:MAG: hypothetical protein IK119_00725, partial [Bacteroidales bacterium]|nr:hypothetical protein [Bacteroidales bacterium]